MQRPMTARGKIRFFGPLSLRVMLVLICFAAAPSFVRAKRPQDSQLRQQFLVPPRHYRIVQYSHPLADRLEFWKPYGVGGVKGFTNDFLRELSHPKFKDPNGLRPLIEKYADAGFQIWLADDFGYPSGMAGGRVVEENPDVEVRGLARLIQSGCGRTPVSFSLPDDLERIVAAVLYPLGPDGAARVEAGQVVSPLDARSVQTEGLDGPWQLSVFALKIIDRDSQAQRTMEQFGHSGRYPDLMNPDAVKRFLELMHERIADLIGEGFADKVNGFYTNEPHLMVVRWNREEGLYAFLPWNVHLPALFGQKHGYDLLPRLEALYVGDDRESRRTRMHFHQTVAERLTDSFARQIRQWCAARGVLSSGHFLLNEYLSMHVACYGDLMKFASAFDVPALDIGIPNPDRIASFPYQQTKFFSSVAAWKEYDTVICLADPMIAGGGLNRLSPAMPLLRNTVNMAFLHGANQITSYLPLEPVPDRATGYTPQEYNALNDYIGRISLLLRGARRETAVGLYYPIAMFQADYKPLNHFWNVVVQQHTARQQAWEQTEQALLDAGIDYNIIHPDALETARVRKDTVHIGADSYRYLVMPQVDILSAAAMDKLRQFQAGGGTVLWVDSKPTMGAYRHEDPAVAKNMSGVETLPVGALAEKIKTPYDKQFRLVIESAGKPISIARFRREGRCVYYLVNRSQEAISIPLHHGNRATAEHFDPFTGQTSTLHLPAQVHIKGLGSVLIVQ